METILFSCVVILFIYTYFGWLHHEKESKNKDIVIDTMLENNKKLKEKNCDNIETINELITDGYQYREKVKTISNLTDEIKAEHQKNKKYIEKLEAAYENKKEQLVKLLESVSKDELKYVTEIRDLKIELHNKEGVIKFLQSQNKFTYTPEQKQQVKEFNKYELVKNHEDNNSTGWKMYLNDKYMGSYTDKEKDEIIKREKFVLDALNTTPSITIYIKQK